MKKKKKKKEHKVFETLPVKFLELFFDSGTIIEIAESKILRIAALCPQWPESATKNE